MSRYYKMSVTTIGIPKETLEKVLIERFGWEGRADGRDDRVYFSGEGSLYGGQSEGQAHSEIACMLKTVYPDAKVRSAWTYMEDLPYEEYGDEIDFSSCTKIETVCL